MKSDPVSEQRLYEIIDEVQARRQFWNSGDLAFAVARAVLEDLDITETIEVPVLKGRPSCHSCPFSTGPFGRCNREEPCDGRFSGAVLVRAGP